MKNCGTIVTDTSGTQPVHDPELRFNTRYFTVGRRCLVAIPRFFMLSILNQFN